MRERAESVIRRLETGQFFSDLRGTNSKTTYYLTSHFFRLNTLKNTAEAPAVELFRLNTFRGTKTGIFNP